MKKVFSVLLVLVFVMGLSLVNVQFVVKAEMNSIFAPGDWQVPSSVKAKAVDVTAEGAPSYLKLVTNGISINAPAKICHQFTGAQYDWVAEVRQLVDETWVKVKTTTTLDNTSGESYFKSCAQANKAGTYALFAYYHVAVAEVSPGNEDTYENSDKWTRGTVTLLDMLNNPAPEWLDLYSNGIKVTSIGEICHPFPSGVRNMVAEIRELKSGVWTKIKTSFKYIPPIDGVYMACAKAPEAGTYALFGYVSH
ncbi:MAG: hypothetical protein CVU42_01565 [Chloroflexi bacterium HGW-Chloroflexi-4]|nr:MAG: hypothetical protein CVU42_01565 [Chloroflexi bacterium HGW-Chloroflexi-4]